MILEVFTILDRCSGLYSEPFYCVNADVAKRRFKQICLSSNVLAPDLQLYKIGVFDSSKGLILPLDNLEFLEGGVASEK